MQKLAWKKRKLEEEGEMGVGTLLIFIAMILVAAVAAGVLVQTAYKLQSQAEQTGDQALMEVATGLKVLAVWGDIDAAGTTITTLNIKVALQAGSPDVNLENVLIELTTTSATEEVDFATTTVNFVLTELRDVEPANPANQMSAGDIYLITIDISTATGTDQELGVQMGMSALLIPKHGVPTYFSIVAPSVFPDTTTAVVVPLK